ncbi:MAG TPA: hypothetical protein VMT59_15910 [Gaiellaceae bacterium]|nr:hypothetical protein [Gaiellaceae bacterium]
MTAPDGVTDAAYRRLVSLRDADVRRFHEEDDSIDQVNQRLDRIYTRISAHQQDVQTLLREALALERDRDRREIRLGRLGLRIADRESAIQAVRVRRKLDAADTPAGSYASKRRGPAGIRNSILAVMATLPEADWSPQRVRTILGERKLTAHNVAHTMHRMAADGEIERLGYGKYRFLHEDPTRDVVRRPTSAATKTITQREQARG